VCAARKLKHSEKHDQSGILAQKILFCGKVLREIFCESLFRTEMPMLSSAVNITVAGEVQKSIIFRFEVNAECQGQSLARRKILMAVSVGSRERCAENPSAR
jgi:hypothetical protein